MALYASRDFEEVHMEVLIAMFDLGVALAIVVLAVVAAFLGYRVIHGIRVYSRFRGTRLVTCPETHQDAVVEVAARSMGMQAILDKPCLRISECSRWPMRLGCGQDCLRQIEARPSEWRISSAWRAS
jgi:hypothetical protein